MNRLDIMKNDARSDVLHEKNLCQTMKKIWHSFEPDLNQRPMDIWFYQLQSTALPTELSKDSYTVINNSFILQIQKETSFYSQA